MNENTIRNKSLASLGLDELRSAREELAQAESKLYYDHSQEAKTAAANARRKVFEIEDAYRQAYPLLLATKVRKYGRKTRRLAAIA